MSFIHERFGQGAIAQEFVDGRELYVGIRLTPDGQVWVLRANANPFISYGHDMANTPTAAGMEFRDFIQRIVAAAVARYELA